uniref:Uncharacterized protein n=1 Tax=Oryza brachyantha TaxID=4533 RepID=J3LV30_ORYBR
MHATQPADRRRRLPAATPFVSRPALAATPSSPVVGPFVSHPWLVATSTLTLARGTPRRAPAANRHGVARPGRPWPTSHDRATRRAPTLASFLVYPNTFTRSEEAPPPLALPTTMCSAYAADAALHFW